MSRPAYAKAKPTGTCDGGDCNRRALSMAYCPKLDALIPVCARHLCAYRIKHAPRVLWQAEDEWIGLQWCRRSRWRIVAQLKLLADQYWEIVFGVRSPTQALKTWRAQHGRGKP